MRTSEDQPCRSDTTNPMSLDDAIALLCDVHLREIDDERWSVLLGALPEFPWQRDNYVRAWEAMRSRLMEFRHG